MHPDDAGRDHEVAIGVEQGDRVVLALGHHGADRGLLDRDSGLLADRLEAAPEDLELDRIGGDVSDGMSAHVHASSSMAIVQLSSTVARALGGIQPVVSDASTSACQSIRWPWRGSIASRTVNV